MRIFLDISSAAKREKTGIAFYIQNLLRAFSEEDSENKYSLFCRFSRLKGLKYLPSVKAPNFRRVASPLHLLSCPHADIAHGLDGRIFKVGKAKRVVTIHDTFSVVSDRFAEISFRERKVKFFRYRITSRSSVLIQYW